MEQKINRSAVLNMLKIHSSVVEAYVKNPDDYVRTFTVQINGKKRHIITYKADKNGAALRYYHMYVANLIPLCYESMPNSFAYKKGFDILSCLEEHLESNTFLKTDIHEFFNSIQYEKLTDLVLEDTVCRRNKSLIKLALKACFYEGHMPIGFVTSPVLSDLYLHKVDQFFADNNIVYTRYADDFIISGKDNMSLLEKTLPELQSILSAYGLELNEKKTYFRTLRQPGDAIHVLGLNLVNDAPKANRITVSDRYIRETSKNICEYLAESRDIVAEEKEYILSALRGKAGFIRHCSPSSYKKLEKMVSVKCGEKVELEEELR